MGLTQLGERSQVIYEKQDSGAQSQGMVPSFLRQLCAVEWGASSQYIL